MRVGVVFVGFSFLKAFPAGPRAPKTSKCVSISRMKLAATSSNGAGCGLCAPLSRSQVTSNNTHNGTTDTQEKRAAMGGTNCSTRALRRKISLQEGGGDTDEDRGERNAGCSPSACGRAVDGRARRRAGERRAEGAGRRRRRGSAGRGGRRSDAVGALFVQHDGGRVDAQRAAAGRGVDLGGNQQRGGRRVGFDRVLDLRAGGGLAAGGRECLRRVHDERRVDALNHDARGEGDVRPQRLRQLRAQRRVAADDAPAEAAQLHRAGHARPGARRERARERGVGLGRVVRVSPRAVGQHVVRDVVAVVHLFVPLHEVVRKIVTELGRDRRPRDRRAQCLGRIGGAAAHVVRETHAALDALGRAAAVAAVVAVPTMDRRVAELVSVRARALRAHREVGPHVAAHLRERVLVRVKA
mmetsp:Transcript_36898/g.113951  ORF Transcript_36898/g.113951 Transcript_36898/m.113951 type:complete len:412 (+) Transcript_36898:84-1319(+)